MSTPDKPTSLAAALARFQADLPKIDKSKTARVKGKTKDGVPFDYTYAYAGLAEIEHEAMPLLGALGLSFSARPTVTTGGQFVLAYTLLHSSGDMLTGEYPLPSPNSSTPQAIGSAITYARRYCFCAATGVVAEDDDDGAEAQRAARSSNRGQRRSEPSSARVERDHAEALASGGEPDDEDDWPEAARPGSGRPASQNENRRRAMMAEFARVKLPDGSSLADDKNRAARIDGINKVIGPERVVASSGDLTPAEVEQVIVALKRRNTPQVTTPGEEA
jgi:ERF superfamily